MPEKVAMIARIVPRTGRTGELRDVLKSMLKPTHGEPGCITYDLHEHTIGAELTFVFYEVWRSEGDLDRHMQTDHVRRLTEHLGELVEGEIAIERLTSIEA